MYGTAGVLRLQLEDACFVWGVETALLQARHARASLTAGKGALSFSSPSLAVIYICNACPSSHTSIHIDVSLQPI